MCFWIGCGVDLAPVCRRNAALDRDAAPLPRWPSETQVISQMKANWQDTLAAAAEELDKIDQAARSLHQQDNRYIRPIAVVRVERTGRDQRDGMRVHAEDAREFLLQNLGIPPEAIRVKSAQNDELGREDLLSEGSAVRWIITKAALMEGWDCPFAYLLVL